MNQITNGMFKVALRGLHLLGLQAVVAVPLAVFAILGISMSMHAQDIEAPPLEPEAEVVVVESLSFSEKCLSTAMKSDPNSNWQLDQPLLTKEEKWGLVWRFDFTLRGKDMSPLVNRIVCWAPVGGEIAINIAIGQRLTRLPLTK